MGLKDRFITRGRATGNDSSSDDNAPPGEVGNADRELKRFRKQHRWDPFLEQDKLEAIDDAIATGDTEKEAAVDASLIQEDSPYPEVRAAVPPTDDTEMPVSTLRAWVIGGICCTVVAACNVLLTLRRAPTSISSTVVQLIAYPMGVAWAKYVPHVQTTFLGIPISTNPGPFNVKEHTIITMMTAAGSAVSYAFDILLAQEIFYNQRLGWGFQILLVLSTQAMGFGLAGVARRYLVWPSSMVWPANLITTTVMFALHNHTGTDPAEANGWSIGRYQLFMIIAGATFVWEFVPQVFAQFLQVFLFPCWIAPNNVVVNQVFGGQSGIGILPISFDWNIFNGFLGSPLQTPAFAIGNVLFGLLLALCGIVGLGFAGPEFQKYLPLSANANFDNTAQPYNVSLVLTPDYTFNETAYKEYSPILISAAFSFSYGMGFASLISTVTHVALFYGPDIIERARSAKSEEPDIHLKLMRKYKEAPEWWFMAVFAISFAMGMIASQHWPTHLTWWAFIICILIPVFLIVPVGIIQAVTNQQTGLNLITELIIGFMLPGRPVAMMLFKSWGYMTCANGLTYISDMKVGHYMKIPPRSMFAAQLFAVVWLSLVQTASYNFLRGNIEGICTPTQAQGLTCPNARTFYNASVIWGLIGPRRIFGIGSLYAWTNWFWFIGFAAPVIQFFVARRYPKSFLRFVFFPAIFGASGLIPPATVWYLLCWACMGLVFNWGIKRAYKGWWTNYNYVVSGALDIGTAFCIVVTALALGLSGVEFPNWWGNTVPFNNLDANGLALTKTFQPGQKPLGPSSW